ncbi:MAG TPA: cytochrome c [Gaiellaceae bacterium]|nr:cytochrome c [Gaiellaceae bacterium]
MRAWIPIAVVAALLAAGCGGAGTGGLSSGGDTARGEELFKQQCGSCHTLAAAATAGTVGPNLDDAFASVRAQGFEASSIQQLVAGQIKFPVTEPSTGEPGMPADLVTGDDVDAVAAYVASVAGVPGAAPPPPPGDGQALDGKSIFTTNCGSCHTLADAGTTGTIGPNLDQALPSVALAVDRVTNGKGVMPPFEGTLTEKQIQAVAEYVSSSAGK